MFDFEEDASDNPTFYADLTNPQSLNKYQYTYNNPYKYTDKSGHCPPCDNPKPAVIAPLVWGIAAVVVAIITGPDTAVAPTGRETAEENRSYRSTGGNNALVNLIPMPAVFRFLPKSASRTAVNQAVSQPAKQIVTKTVKQTASQTTKLSKVKKSVTTKTVGKFTKTTKVTPGRGPGQSRSEMVKVKNQNGKTIKVYKDSYDRANKFQHRKHKLPVTNQ